MNLDEILDEMFEYVTEKLDNDNYTKVTFEYDNMTSKNADLICRHFIIKYKVTLEYKMQQEYNPYNYKETCIITIENK